MNKQVSVNTLPNEFEDANGVKIKGKQDIANGFNDFFVNVGPNLANNIQCENDKTIHSYLKERNESSMFLSPVDVNEVLRTVNTCSNKTSTDYDEMSMSLVKNIICDVITPFTYICNLSFENSMFPDKMKVAKVVPLFKSGSQNHFTNYRPVSLLPQFSKVLEKLFDVRLQKFIDKYNVLHDSQYGFRSNRSTSLALMELIEEICTEIDNKNVTIGVFIDLKKAFDTIDHKLLLQKLEFYGIRGAANEWVKSYLSCRKQYVQVDEYSSKLRDIICGVPQGSVLGPKLFILYINDLCNVSNLVKYVLFADDTNIFKSGRNMHELSKEISGEMNKLNVWFNVNKLSLNVSKTHFMVFGKLKHIGNIKITINDVEIEHVSVTKFLGVLIDEKLNWLDHINKVKSKLSKCIAIIYKARERVNKDALLILYNSLFLPHLSYCCEVWANTYKTNLHKIIILQKRVMRIIHKVDRFSHTSLLFHKMFSLKFVDIVKFKSLQIMHKAYHNCLPKNVQSYFVLNNVDSVYNTRATDKFKIKYVRTSLKSKLVSVVGPKLWNELPRSITCLVNIVKFKRILKIELVNKYLHKD